MPIQAKQAREISFACQVHEHGSWSSEDLEHALERKAPTPAPLGGV
jgi:hypothetical protein